VEKLWRNGLLPRESDVPRLSITLGRLLLLALAAASAVALLLLPPGAGARRPQGVRPNILVIMTDDETVENMRVMANVNRLIAEQGTTLVNSFVSYSLCCPSRATFLTGQYSHNNGVVGNNYENGLSRLDQTNTLAVWLKNAGYTTALIGKYLNDYAVHGHSTRVPPGWSVWYAGARLAYYGHSMDHNGKIVEYGHRARDYQTDVYTRLALKFIAGHARSSKPFFLWLSYWAPHYGGPRERGDPPLPTPVPARRDKGRFAHEPLPHPPSFNEANVSDKPSSIQRRPLLTDAEIAAITSDYRQRLESLLAVDDGVRKVIDALKARGALKHTLIVFTSDNGYLQGEHRVPEGKELPYEPSIRVPLIVRGPGVPAGRHLEQIVANIDLAPTLVDAAGAHPGRVFDGRSLLPLFADPNLFWGRDLLLERGPGPAPLAARQFTGIRTPRYVYVEYRGGERELYDLAHDPDEIENRTADALYAGVEAELARRLAALRDCAGASCRIEPELQLTLEVAGTCVSSVRITGVDEPYVAYVDFLVNGRGVRRDESAPFDLSLTGIAGETRLRAIVTMSDGRRMTLDRTVAACG
jgi:N-acetylglucosamine-6-sulfatase